MRVVECQLSIIGRAADDCHGAALTLTHGLKAVELFGQNAKYVALLGFIAPNFHGAHGAVLIVDGT